MDREPQVSGYPVHAGIIMDGNGRWAQRRGLKRTQGHLEGLKAAKRIVKAARDMGVKYLTLYAFSTENWKRTAEETGFIMSLVKQHLRAELDFYRENRIRIRHAGDSGGLPPDIQKELSGAINDTKDFDGMQVILAINYGGRDEIVRAVQKLAGMRKLAAESEPAENIAERDIAGCLDNPDIPDPDLIIRSAGEHRTSNFLLWEGAYSELYFSQKLWPDWEKEDLKAALEDFCKRDRRYGAETASAMSA
ncbi:MAG: polyprenyl diphosphate synthase [Treponema sp.]|nr:polyprenyl diphosphate synthase [Treponema sp.]